jgi:hypothetical protein
MKPAKKTVAEVLSVVDEDLIVVRSIERLLASEGVSSSQKN